jgi:hypothetical protein
MSTKKLQIVTSIVTSINGQTGDVTLDIPDTKTYKAGNGISISDDGTISVTAAKIYSGTVTPDNSLGDNGDIYVQMEG